MNKMKLLKLNIVFCIVLLLSCNENPLRGNLFHSPDFQIPIVPGLRITSDKGPDVIAIWRKPYDSENSNIKNGFPISEAYLDCPYPNPSDGYYDIRFRIAKTSTVGSWIVVASLPETKQSEGVQYFGGYLPSPTGKAVAILLNNEIKQPGYYLLVFHASKSLPAGFYRIYLQVDANLYWRDILLYKKRQDIPPDLMQMLPNNFPLFF